MAEQMEALDDENREAWALFSRVVSRLTLDVPGLSSAVFARVVADMTGAEATELLHRLAVIYDKVHPPPPSQT